MAKYKAQQSSSSRYLVIFFYVFIFIYIFTSIIYLFRLSVHHHPPTLPPNVTLRDDPMTKTQAFLTCMPNLK